MGNRRRQDVWKYFRKVGENFQGKSKMSCNYCGCTYLENATRMATHLHKCAGIKHISEDHNQGAPPVPHSTVNEMRDAPKVDQRSLAEFELRTKSDRQRKNRLNAHEDDPRSSLARTILSGRMSLATLEDPYFLAFLRQLNPGFEPPATASILNEHLHEEHRKMQRRMESLIESANYVVVICRAKENHFNIFLSTTKEEIFLKSFPKESAEASSYNPLYNLVCELGVHKVLGITTDASPTGDIPNFKRFEEECPHVPVYQCAYTSFRKIVDELLSKSSLKEWLKPIEDVVTGVCASESKTSVDLTEFISFFLINNQDVEKISYTLSKQGNLREWAQRCVNIKDPAVQRGVDVITNETFWKKLEKLTDFLLPITSYMTNYEEHPISHVFPFVVTVGSHFEFMLTDSLFENEQREEIMAIFHKHKSNLLHPLHLASNLLDPKIKGASLTIDQQVLATEYIYALASRTEEVNDEDALADLANYRACYGLWGKEYMWKVVHKLHPLSWWNGFCSNTQLAKLSIRLFNLPASCINKTLSSSNLPDQGLPEEFADLDAQRRDMATFLRFNLTLFRGKQSNFVPLAEYSLQEEHIGYSPRPVHKMEPQSPPMTSKDENYQEESKYF